MIPSDIYHVDLHGLPVQYREVQGHESKLFLSYFPHFILMKGGVDSGFHHVSEPPPLDTHKLYRITVSRHGTKSTLAVREVAPEGASLVGADAYVLDKGAHIWQLNTKKSTGQERFKAAEFVHTLTNGRKGKCDIQVYGKALPIPVLVRRH
jgi:gelsolin